MVNFTITNNTTLTWLWETNYWNAFSVAGVSGGTGTTDGVTGWYPSGTNMTVTAMPLGYSVFGYWSGQTNNTAIATNEISFDVDGARGITAVFGPRLTITNAVPYNWLVDAGITSNFEQVVGNDPDGDGFTTGQEYWSGTNPDDPNSYLGIDSVSFIGTNVWLTWRHWHVDSNSIPPVSIQTRVNLTTGNWQTIDSSTPVEGTNTWNRGIPSQRFFRLIVPDIP